MVGVQVGVIVGEGVTVGRGLVWLGAGVMLAAGVGTVVGCGAGRDSRARTNSAAARIRTATPIAADALRESRVSLIIVRRTYYVIAACSGSDTGA
jgi:hypothetical protein